MILPALPPLDNSGGLTVGKIVLGTAGDSDSARAALPAAISTAIGVNPLTNKIPSLQSIVVIIVGLLFVAAGIFAFKEVRQTVITTGKTAAKVAMV